MRRKIISILVILVVVLGSGAAGFAIGKSQHQGKPVDERQPIYPSIYITGSSGKISSIDPIVAGVTADKSTRAKRGLEIIVNDDQTLQISGQIDKHNPYPTIEIGMQTGTNNSLKYENALRVVMSYLGSHYRVPYVNVLGYSAGGSGVYRYMLEYGQDTNLPTVEKFVSLDGQYNASTAQPDQDYQDVLKNGPKIKTDYYKFWEENYQKLDPNVQVFMLAGDYDDKKQTDGVVPWADTFSIYPLLVKNDNPVTTFIFKGANSDHANVPKNTEAINYIKTVFYK